jgi:glycosyltransferase involved in cell wall biosynthesis
VIIPTLGRPTLERQLASIATQLCDGDEVLMVGDGPQPLAAKLAEAFGAPLSYFELRSPKPNMWGDPQRNFAMPLARGDYLVFQDDDNVMLPGAFAAMRAAAAEDPGRPLIFRVRYLDGRIAPSGDALLYGDFDTACGIWPRRGPLGTWPGAYGGDYFFARQTLDLYPDRDHAAVWRPEVIAVHRPHRMPAGQFEKFASQHAPDAAGVMAQAR